MCVDWRHTCIYVHTLWCIVVAIRHGYDQRFVVFVFFWLIFSNCVTIVSIDMDKRFIPSVLFYCLLCMHWWESSFAKQPFLKEWHLFMLICQVKIFGVVVWTNVGRYLFTFIECSSTLCAVFCIDEFSSSNQFFLNGSHESTLLYDISIFLAVVCMDEFSFANGVCLMNGMRPYAFITQAYFVR